MWSLIPMKMIPPTRTIRYCCEVLKKMVGLGVYHHRCPVGRKPKAEEKQGIYETLSQMEITIMMILGRLFESCLSRGKHVCNPIVDWSDQQVWEYIQAEKIPHEPPL